jgi:lipoic acid synthetase
MERHPEWLKVKLPGEGQYYRVRKDLGRLGVHTVCEEARCPNAAECWGGGTATFMILGDTCTRGCRFCGVNTGHPPGPPEPDEPRRVAEAAVALDLRYVVITSVDRDDLPDGGAEHFVATTRVVLERIPGVTVELLVPDFGGSTGALERIVSSGAQVLGHNVETVRALTPAVRDPRCRRLVIKSSLLLGLGECEQDVLESLGDLRAVGVDWVTLGQYLRPSRKHAPVRRYVKPAEFSELERRARQMGFALVSSGPLVRSSYRAGEQQVQLLIKQRTSG